MSIRVLDDADRDQALGTGRDSRVKPGAAARRADQRSEIDVDEILDREEDRFCRFWALGQASGPKVEQGRSAPGEQREELRIVDGQHRTLCLRQLWEWYEFPDADPYTPASTCVGCSEALESRACDKCHTSIMLESHENLCTVTHICTDRTVSANG